MPNQIFWLRHPESPVAIRMRRKAEGNDYKPVGDAIHVDGIYCGDFPAIFSNAEFGDSKKDKENKTFQKVYKRWGGFPGQVSVAL